MFVTILDELEAGERMAVYATPDIFSKISETKTKYKGKSMKKVIIFAWILLCGMVGLADIYTMKADGDHEVKQWPLGWPGGGLSVVLGNDDNVMADGAVGIAVGDFNSGNAGKEIIWARSDGYTIVTDTSGVRVSSGAVLNTSDNHLEYGWMSIALGDTHSASAGNELITVADNNYLQIWDNLGSRLYYQNLADVSFGTIADVAFGDFLSSNEGAEMAILRTDGYIGIWDLFATGTGDRLVNHAPSALYHTPATSIFGGDLDGDASNGDELGILGEDGYYVTVNMETGTRLSADDRSTFGTFSDVAADSTIAVPEPATMGMLGVGTALIMFVRRYTR